MAPSRRNSGCAFERIHVAHQIQMARRHDGVPITRDYIMQEEARLRELEGQHRTPLRLAGG